MQVLVDNLLFIITSIPLRKINTGSSYSNLRALCACAKGNWWFSGLLLTAAYLLFSAAAAPIGSQWQLSALEIGSGWLISAAPGSKYVVQKRERHGWHKALKAHRHVEHIIIMAVIKIQVHLVKFTRQLMSADHGANLLQANKTCFAS